MENQQKPSDPYYDALETLAGGNGRIPWAEISYNHDAKCLIFTTFAGLDYLLHVGEMGNAHADIENNSHISWYAQPLFRFDRDIEPG